MKSKKLVVFLIVKMCKMLFWRDHVEVLWLKKKEKVKAKVKHNKNLVKRQSALFRAIL